MSIVKVITRRLIHTYNYESSKLLLNELTSKANQSEGYIKSSYHIGDI